ncbi:MAG: ABC transporter permease, partial [Pyrinomonadaceae bacterium]|nr:ABC transporter permease [Pyrinomonadaceae bacterium]
MSTLWQDVRYGARMLFKAPGFTLVAVLSLALGISVNTTIFSMVNALILRPLPYEDAQRLVVVQQTQLKQGIRGGVVSLGDFVDWRNENSAFERLAAYYERSFNLAGENEPERVKGASISADLFRTLGVSPVHGRDLVAAEDRPNAERVALISHSLWQRRFNSDANLAGKTLKVNGEDHTIVGVMPPNFKYPSNAELWTPLALDMAEADRGNHYLSCIARLKPGVTLEAAQAQLATIAQRLEAEHPATNKGWGVRVISLREELIDEEARTVLVALLGAVLFVLLIACANVANLLLARSVSREKEMAIRAALGAGRARVIRQLLTESVLISLAGGALGVLLAMWGIDLLVTAIPEQMPFWVRFDIDARVLLFTLSVSLLTGIIFGLVPALQASKPDLQVSLKEGSRSATEGVRRNRLRSLLVVSEIALTLVLLIGAALMMKSFMRLQEVAPGFDPKNVLTLQLWVQGTQYEQDEQRVTSFYSRAVERIRTLPGVKSVGAVSMLPLDSDSSSSTSFVAENHPVPQGEEESAGHTVITPDCLSAIGIPLLRGRDFAETDDENAPPVVIVNDWLARRYFPNDDAVGKRIRLGGPESRWRTIIGVVGDIKRQTLRDKEEAQLYFAHKQDSWRSMTIVVRTNLADPGSLSGAVRGEIWAIDKDQPINNVRTMERVLAVSETVWVARVFGMLFAVLAGVALMLAVGGLYGVIAYSVSQRTHEIGIRMALGAKQGDVLWMVLGQGMILVAAGLALGLVGAFIVTRILASSLYGVTATDPVSFAGIALLLAGVALLASYIPARRATRVD